MRHFRDSPLLTALIAGGVSVFCWTLFWIVFTHMRHVDFGATPFLWHTNGVSMTPAIDAGDDEITSVQDFVALKPGNIVMFRPEGRWTKAQVVCHRIVRGFGGQWVTQGDNNKTADPGYVTKENYIATVEVIIHRHLPTVVH
jgi:signal peptidase I